MEQNQQVEQPIKRGRGRPKLNKPIEEKREKARAAAKKFYEANREKVIAANNERQRAKYQAAKEILARAEQPQ